MPQNVKSKKFCLKNCSSGSSEKYISHRVYIPSGQVRLFGLENEIVSSERNDFGNAVAARHGGQSVGIQTATRDHVPGADLLLKFQKVQHRITHM